MGGANTSSTSTTPGGAFNPQAPVQKATQATAADLAAFDAQQLQNKRIGEGLGALAKGIGEIDFSSPASAALTSQNQADTYKKWLEMQLKNNPDALNFMPMMPFDIKSTNPELISNAWANAGKTLATSAVSGVGKAYGM
jgi:hypothetical protein